MDNKDSKQSQETGGLKLMTVFIAVLALHVVVIGGFTVYHLMSGGSPDADLALDKTHKLKADGTIATDATSTDSTTSDKTASTGTTTAEVTSSPSTTPAPDATPTAPDATPTPAPTPAPAPAPVVTAPVVKPVSVASLVTPTPTPAPTPKPVTPAPEKIATVTPTPAPSLAPPPDATPAPSITMNGTPNSTWATGPLAGPVHMPATTPAPAPVKSAPATSSVSKLAEAPASHVVPHESYTVKITDSYKKIAKAHHITVAQLKSANHIKDDTLHTGQKLIIPMEKSSIAKTESAPAPGEISATTASLSTSSTSATAPKHHTYTVEKGDTLAYIAHKFKTTREALISANDITNPSHLAVGRKLRIPSSGKEKETRSAAVAKPMLRTTPILTPVQPTQQVQMQEPAAPVAQPVQPQPSQQPAATGELANMQF